MDHYQGRGWRVLPRHFFVTQLSLLFCARTRLEFDDPDGDQIDRLTVEQVRDTTNVWLSSADLPPVVRRRRYEGEWRK